MDSFDEKIGIGKVNEVKFDDLVRYIANTGPVKLFYVEKKVMFFSQYTVNDITLDGRFISRTYIPVVHYARVDDYRKNIVVSSVNGRIDYKDNVNDISPDDLVIPVSDFPIRFVDAVVEKFKELGVK